MTVVGNESVPIVYILDLQDQVGTCQVYGVVVSVSTSVPSRGPCLEGDNSPIQVFD